MMRIKVTLAQSFNSRTPGGVRLSTHVFSASFGSFNSRTPGGVRPTEVLVKYLPRSVSIHAPREGCDWGVRRSPVQRDVSIHAPREGCDGKDGLNNYQLAVFQFTHPGRGATRPAIDLTIWLNVSIHAPREGCDVLMSLSQRMSRRFNSRTPGGVRPNAEALKRMREQFQFTHPGRGATGSSYR